MLSPVAVGAIIGAMRLEMLYRRLVPKDGKCITDRVEHLEHMTLEQDKVLRDQTNRLKRIERKQKGLAKQSKPKA